MNLLSRRSFNTLLGATSFALIANRASADDWPTRPVTIIMPFAAGSGPDSLARALAADLSEQLGGRFIVENRAGAGGNIGGATVAKAAPDGYTFLLATNGPGAVNKLIYKDMQYDPEQDLESVGLVSEIPAIIAASPQSPARSFQELIAYGKANPDKINYGSPGNGTLGHILGILVQRETGIRMTHVPYRGSGPLTTDLIGGQVNLAFDFMSTYAPLIAEKRIHGIALLSKERYATIPDVPTIQEVGVKRIDSSGWCALFAPKRTPNDIVDRINRSINKYVTSEKGTNQLKSLSMTPAGGSPADLRGFVSREISKWSPVIKDANISI